jgi:hypothetical protein
MRKKFKSETSARKFAKGRKMKRGKACKMADGSKGHWYTIYKKAKK